MFNRKKRIYEKKGFYILIMSVLLIALGIFAIPWGGGENADASNTAAQTPVPDEEDNWWEDDEDDEEYTDDNTENTDENRQQNKLDDIDKSQLPYYMVLEENGLISVYYYDKNGNISKYKDTEITYSLLNEADQMSFSEGIMVKTKDALMELLQDFES